MSSQRLWEGRSGSPTAGIEIRRRATWLTSARGISAAAGNRRLRVQPPANSGSRREIVPSPRRRRTRSPGRCRRDGDPGHRGAGAGGDLQAVRAEVARMRPAGVVRLRASGRVRGVSDVLHQRLKACASRVRVARPAMSSNPPRELRLRGPAPDARRARSGWDRAAGYRQVRDVAMRPSSPAAQFDRVAGIRMTTAILSRTGVRAAVRRGIASGRVARDGDARARGVAPHAGRTGDRAIPSNPPSRIGDSRT